MTYRYLSTVFLKFNETFDPVNFEIILMLHIYKLVTGTISNLHTIENIVLKLNVTYHHRLN